MELALVATIISSFMYWFVVKDEATSKLDWKKDNDRKIIIHLAFLHVVPLLTTLINFLISNIAFLNRDWVYIFYSVILYGLVNYIITVI
jgi:hypothetical protein